LRGGAFFRRKRLEQDSEKKPPSQGSKESEQRVGRKEKRLKAGLGFRVNVGLQEEVVPIR